MTTHKSLNILNLLTGILQIFSAVAHALAFISGALIMVTNLNGNTFFSDVSVEAASSINLVSSPFVLLFRLLATISYITIAVGLFKNRQLLEKLNYSSIKEWPYYLGIVTTGLVFLFNIFLFKFPISLLTISHPIIQLLLLTYLLFKSKLIITNN